MTVSDTTRESLSKFGNQVAISIYPLIGSEEGTARDTDAAREYQFA